MPEIAKKILYTDLDNTVANKKTNTLYPSVLNSLNLFGATRLGLATTRGFKRAEQIVRADFKLPWIIENGSVIYTHEGKQLELFPLRKDEKEAIADLIERRFDDIRLAVFYPKDLMRAGNRAIIYSPDSEKLNQLVSEKKIQMIIKEITINPFHFADSLRNSLTGMVEIDTSYSDLMFPKDLNVTSDGIFYITSQGINKGHALNRVCEKQNFDISNLIVSGDGQTDQSMFDLPNVTSIAVNNPKLKATYHVNNPESLSKLLMNLAKSD